MYTRFCFRLVGRLLASERAVFWRTDRCYHGYFISKTPSIWLSLWNASTKQSCEKYSQNLCSVPRNSFWQDVGWHWRTRKLHRKKLSRPTTHSTPFSRSSRRDLHCISTSMTASLWFVSKKRLGRDSNVGEWGSYLAFKRHNEKLLKRCWKDL